MRMLPSTSSMTYTGRITSSTFTALAVVDAGAELSERARPSVDAGGELSKRATGVIGGCGASALFETSLTRCGECACAPFAERLEPDFLRAIPREARTEASSSRRGAGVRNDMCRLKG